MFFYFITIILLAGQISCKRKPKGKTDIADLVKAAVEALPSLSDYSDEEVDEELEKFYKHVENTEVESVKQKFRAELRAQDKKEEKYFEDILKKLQMMGSSSFSLGDALSAVNESEKSEKLRKKGEDVRKKLRMETKPADEASAMFGVK